MQIFRLLDTKRYKKSRGECIIGKSKIAAYSSLRGFERGWGWDLGVEFMAKPKYINRTGIVGIVFVTCKSG